MLLPIDFGSYRARGDKVTVMKRLVAIALVGLVVGGMGCATQSRKSAPVGAEAVSLLGHPLFAPALEAEVLVKREADRAAAARAAVLQQDSEQALIWLGRRTAYLGRFQESVAIYTEGLVRFQNSARLLRHRGHRWITLREFERAVTDFEAAKAAIDGTADEIEPDGIPNPSGIPTSTLHSNIHYHLALAHYLHGDFAAAAHAHADGAHLNTTPERMVSAGYWHALALLRAGRRSDATTVLAPITADFKVEENGAYHQLCLALQGHSDPEALWAAVRTQDSGNDKPTIGYGVAVMRLLRGDSAGATALLTEVVQSGPWAAFGAIAAEADLARGLTR